MNSPDRSVLLETREVSLEVLERELAALWTSGGETSSAIKACALNLIVVIEGPSFDTLLAECIGDITVDHPGRAFLIAMERSTARESLSTWVSARCSIPSPGERQVCSEQIMIEASGSAVARVPSIVRSLLVPDVPTVLLWKTHADQDDTVLQALLGISDRVVNDSAEDTAPEKSIPVWDNLVNQYDGRVSSGDLAWTHLDDWRAILAQMVQPLHMRSLLENISSINVEYTISVKPFHSGLSQSLLLAGWLCSRLEWHQVQPIQFTGDAEWKVNYRRGEGPISFETKRSTREAWGPGGILLLKLQTLDGRTLALVSDEAGFLHSSFREGDTLISSSVHPLREPTDHALLSREMDVLDRDFHYERALASAAGSLRNR